MKDIRQWRLFRKSYLAAEEKITDPEMAAAYLEHVRHHIHELELWVWQNRPLGKREVIYWYVQCIVCGHRHSVKRSEVPERLSSNHKCAVDWDAANRLRARHSSKASDAYELKRISYHDYLNSDAWAEKRKIAFETHGARCQICQRQATQIHHLTYANLGQEKTGDLMPLCQWCHRMIHETNSRVHRYDKQIVIWHNRRHFSAAEWLLHITTPKVT